MNPEKSKEQEDFERKVRRFVDHGYKFNVKFLLKRQITFLR